METNQNPYDTVLARIYNTLHEYQKQMVEFVIGHFYCGLFLPCGAGKTLVTLTALARIRANGHTLIVGPKPVARATWPQEIEKWGIPQPTLSLVVNENGKTLTKKKREELYEYLKTAPPTICYINAENIPRLVDYFQDNWIFPIVVLDEAQMFKSYKSKRFKKLASVRDRIARLIELSGTPTPNSMQDLWPLIYLLDQGYRLGPNITAYRNTFFNPGLVVDNYPVKWTLKYGAEQDIYALISDLVVSIEAHNVQLPPVSYVYDYVSIDKDARTLYNELKKENVLALAKKYNLLRPQSDDTLASDEFEQILAKNSAVLSGKLRQMASGTMYTDEDKHYVVIHTEKLAKTDEIISQAGSPVLIAYCFKSDLKELLSHFEQTGVKAVAFNGSREMTEAWNRREIPVMLIQPASAGHGLNLQQGGHTLIWYTVPWSLEHYLQTNARIYRQGQNHDVFIHHIMCRNTIDNDVKRAIEEKDFTMSRLLSAVRAQF